MWEINNRPTVIDIVKIWFDNLENKTHDAIHENIIETFIDNENGLAINKANEWLKQYKSEQFYIGWNYDIYPQLKIIARNAWEPKEKVNDNE